MTESWECPKCQTLNAFGDQCYSCGAPRPDAPPASEAAAPAPPIDMGWDPAPAAIEPTPAPEPAPEPAPDEDTEPHPCWCDLVKGPHDTRDHPPTAETEDDLEADAHLDQLEAELALLTRDWTVGQVQRSHDDDDDGEQDYEDEMLIFEDHGYTKVVERHHHRIDATYTSPAAHVGPLDWKA
jgi:hypothetical protein